MCRAVALEVPAVTPGFSPADEAEEIDAGFHLLHDLKVVEAHAQFAVWQNASPEDPLGETSEVVALSQLLLHHWVSPRAAEIENVRGKEDTAQN